MSAGPLAVNSLSPERVAPKRSMSLTGVALFVIGLLLLGSAFKGARLEIGGLYVHPHLFLIGLFLFTTAIPRIGFFPRAVLIAMGGFMACYLISILLGPPGGADEIFKVAASAVTGVTVALLVRKDSDVRAAAIGMMLATTVLAIRALASGNTGLEGINPLEGIANKNAFSLYCLPALLLGGFILLEMRSSLLVSLTIAGCMVITIAAVFASANRSGWLGVLVIAVLLQGGTGRIRTTVLLALVGAAVYLLLTNYTGTSVFEYRLEQTLEGYRSDELRQSLFTESLNIGLEHPLFGVSPQLLPFVLAARVHSLLDAIDPHNLFGLIIGGGGFVTLAALLGFAWALWRRPVGLAQKKLASQVPLRNAHNLVRMMILLTGIRGMFSREILYTPAFAMGIGITIGLCIIRGAWLPQRQTP